MPTISVSTLDIMAEAEWSFREQLPRLRHRLHGSSGTFDPFPGYPHDIANVETAATLMELRWPPLWDVEIYVADREEEGRSNGYSSVHEGSHYEGDSWVKDEPVGLIVLSGKRVPPHPSITKYLIAHEYGHNVQWMIASQRELKHLHDDALMQEYIEVRGLDESTMHHGSGGRWHDSVHEIFACDFRLIVCGVEPDYWPHPGIPHPYENNATNKNDEVITSALCRWWRSAKELQGHGEDLAI